MSVRGLSSREKEMITLALNMRCNFIETGTISLSARDVEKMNPKDALGRFGARIKALSGEQMQLILKSKELERGILSDNFYIDEPE